MPNIKRGDIYYIRDNGNATGPECRKDRPGIIVSNDTGNKHSPVVSVVYLTTAPKHRRLPTHVDVMCMVKSTAMCEHVYSVSVERLDRCIGHITGSEQEAIDRALAIALQIEQKEENPVNEIMITTNKTPIEVLLQVDDDGTVSAKNVYEFLQLDQSHYSRWCKVNIEENQFAEESVDFKPFAIEGENLQGGRPTVDYKLTISFAKKLCMKQGNERGEQARDYFIKVEEKHKEAKLALNALSPQLQLLINMELKQKELETQQRCQAALLEAANGRIDEAARQMKNIRDVLSVGADSSADDMHRLVTKIAQAQGGNHYIQAVYSEIYQQLEHRAHCDLKTRQNNAKNRAARDGMSKTSIEKITRLVIVKSDPRLKEIFLAIAKEFSIKYGATA